MIYALLMTAGILEFIFALVLVLKFFDLEDELQIKYTEGYFDGVSDQIAVDSNWTDDEYYDALVDEANCWFGIEGD